MMGDQMHPIRTALTCVSIVANALFGGAMYTFPILIPALSSHLKLTQPQLSSIILAGMAIQYPFSALVGKLVDWRGPGLVSFLASISFFLAFGLASWEVSSTPADIEEPSLASFRRLIVCFALAGIGTTFSVFTFLMTGAKTFPNHTGTMSGISMASFGLSPLFFSFIASGFFTDPIEGLNASDYLHFSAVATGIVFLIGAFVMRVPSSSTENDAKRVGDDEHTQLLPDELHQEPILQTQDSVRLIFQDRNFWLLAFVLAIILGACEMILSNIGTIVLSLSSRMAPSESTPTDDDAASTQVRLLSLANTISRLIVGPLADYLGPRGGVIAGKTHLSRMAFVAGPALLLCLSFASVISWVRTREAMWILSVSTGIAYGTTFTIIPSIVSKVWGVANLGRNFGIINYAPFIGNPLFSYLYAIVSKHHAHGELVCHGPQCWQLTMSVAMGSSFIALLVSLALWRRWGGAV